MRLLVSLNEQPARRLFVIRRKDGINTPDVGDDVLVVDKETGKRIAAKVTDIKNHTGNGIVFFLREER